MRTKTWWSAAVVALALTACAPVGSGGPSEPTETPSIVAIYSNVEFYPACGNEELIHLGVHWYSESRPVDSAGDAAGPATRPAPAGFGLSRSLGSVVAPGPGDDVGTLTVYSDDTAHWVSHSGDLDRWLTREVRTYNWVC